MKKLSETYIDKVVSYYHPKRKKQPAQPALVVTKSFDNGLTVPRSSPAMMSAEYDVMAAKEIFVEYEVVSGDDGLTPYEVVSSKTGGSASNAQTEDFYVESFEELIAGSDSSVQPAERANGNKPAGTPAIPIDPEKAKEDALQAAKIPDIPDTPEIPNLKDITGKNKVSENDFLADMKSILKGDALYDPQAKQLVSKENTLSKARSQQPPAKKEKEEEAPALEVKNEHAIFDRIAQNMKYANAYDLGSFEMEQRFDDFDVIEPVKEMPKTEIKRPSRSSSIAQPKVNNEEFVSDLDIIAAESTAASTPPAPEIPLDPGVGGRSIMTAAMQPGDIIISTTNADISKKIRQATGSQVSHAAIYIGNDQVIESIEDGVMLFSVETSIMEDIVAVAYRHKDITPEKAAKVVGFLKKMKDERRKFDYWGLLRVAPYQMISKYCDSLNGTLKDACKTAANRFKLGTDNNNEFYCSELVFAAYKEAGLEISDVDPHWSSAQDVVRLNHNSTLQYVGHLKA